MAATSPAEREAAAKRAIDAIQDLGLGRNISASDQPTVTGPVTSRDNPSVLDAERHDRQLEEGLEESFPASDPPAVTQPSNPPAPVSDETCAADRLDKAEQDRQLEEGLEETFPASDPVSITRPEHSIGAPPRPPEEDDEPKVADFLKKPT
jgi:hypothetical protein